MKIKLIEDPLICPACNPWMTVLASHDRQCGPGAMPGYLVIDETKGTDEQVRLRRSWEAVLTEIGPRELGGSRW
jgi:hypothetical protein